MGARTRETESRTNTKFNRGVTAGGEPEPASWVPLATAQMAARGQQLGRWDGQVCH